MWESTDSAVAHGKNLLGGKKLYVLLHHSIRFVRDVFADALVLHVRFIEVQHI